MTKEVEEIAKKCAAAGTEVYAVSPPTGPASVESLYDEALAIPGVLSEVIKGDREEGADAFIVACFGDPGLEAAKEVTDKPVIGIAQAAITMARLMSANFSIIYSNDHSKKLIQNMIALHDAERQCVSIRDIGLSVLEAEDKELCSAALMKTARAFVEEDKAECILLGCAGYVGYAEQMKAELGVLVMDGVVPAVKLCEAAVSMGIKTPKKTLMDEFSEEIKSCQLTMYQPSYHMDDEVREAIRKGCDELGLSRREMGSGAGHDSMSLAQATKAGMIFVPSVKGVSHNKEEFTSWEDIENGANVLLNTLRILDK